MRSFLTTIGVLVTTVFLSTSCKKPEAVTPAPPVNRGNFYATIDNQQWNANYSYADLQADGTLKIVGSINGKTLEMTLPGIDLKTYKINSVTPGYAFYTDSSDVPVIHFDSQVDAQTYAGQITLTKVDPVNKTVSGTFSLILRNTIDGSLISAEDGVFNSVKYGIIPGETLFVGFNSVDDKGGVKIFFRDHITGKIKTKNVVDFTSSTILNHTGIFDSIGQSYFSVEEGLTGRTARYVDMGVNDINYSISANDNSGMSFSPAIYSKSKYYTVSHEGGVTQFVDFTAVSGAKGVVYDTLYNQFTYWASNGSDIFAYGDSARMIHYSPATKSRKVFPMGAKYKELDYLSGNDFVSLSIDGTGATTTRTLYKLTVVNDSVTSAKIITGLGIAGFQDAEQSLSYSSPKNKVLYTVYDSARKRSYLATLDLITLGIKRDTINGFVDGIRAY